MQILPLQNNSASVCSLQGIDGKQRLLFNVWLLYSHSFFAKKCTKKANEVERCKRHPLWRSFLYFLRPKKRRKLCTYNKSVICKILRVIGFNSSVELFILVMCARLPIKICLRRKKTVIVYYLKKTSKVSVYVSLRDSAWNSQRHLSASFLETEMAFPIRKRITNFPSWLSIDILKEERTTESNWKRKL